MTAKSALLALFLRLLLSFAYSDVAAAQTATGTTQNEVWPEGDVHLQLPSNFRALAFAGLEQGVGYPFQQWYVASALGYQFKPILRPHWENIDPDKEHYLLFGAGYEYLYTTDSGKVKHEDRVTIDLTASFRPLAKLLVRDRNWAELRWINDNYSTTYRNMVLGEFDCRFHGVRVTPFGSAEFFYDGSKHSWDQQWYTGGVELPYKRIFMLETYYRREHCQTCVPQDWNLAGVTVHFFFKNYK